MSDTEGIESRGVVLSVLLPTDWAPLDNATDYAQGLQRLLGELGKAESLDLSKAAPLTDSFVEVKRLLESTEFQLAAIHFDDGDDGDLETNVMTVAAILGDESDEVEILGRWRERGDIAPLESVGRAGMSNQFQMDIDRPGSFRYVTRYLIKDLALLVISVFSTSRPLESEAEEILLASVGLLDPGN